jgi:hypothetical protein
VNAHLRPALLAAVLSAVASRAGAHSGPPFPIVSDERAGAYEISVWTDPDTTDDETPGGQFWIIVHRASGEAAPAETKVRVTATPLASKGKEQTAAAAIERDPSRYFAAVRLDHEGRWSVQASIDGPLGPATVAADVEATYDIRPSPRVLGFYLLPFLLVGFLWIKALRRGRRPRS